MEARSRPVLGTRSIEVTNRNLDGLALKDVPALAELRVIVSRLLRGGESRIVRGDSILKLGDVLLAVGPAEGLDRARLIIGRDSEADPRAAAGELTTRRVLVTRREPLGRSVPELDLLRRFGVAITRITRGGVQLSPTPGVGLQFGDSLLAVGPAEALAQVAQELGDSPSTLQHPPLIPMFVGIGLGVLLGTMPIPIPGLPAPMKLGLAGGPLLVAMVLSRLGHVGPLVWYMPGSASTLLRELGMALFLTAVGLASGDQFVPALRGPGLAWVGYGVLITLVPILLMSLIARAVYKLNYLHICGLLAGSMTDPPALAMATTMTRSQAPAVAYATVYPLVMLLRVLAAQGLVLLLL
jgi:putative transport protein